MSHYPKPASSPEYQHLRKVLIAARQQAGLTQTALAARMGRSRPWISALEGGQRRLDFVDFYHLVAAMGCKPSAVAAAAFKGFRGPAMKPGGAP
jgi:transcriptional regulator with XRE-family HTH domain